MTAWIFADAGSTTLAAPISTTPTPGTTETWTLTSTTGSPALPQITSGQQYGATVLPPGGDTNPEVVVVTAILNGTQVTVLRGQGTNGVVKTHSTGDTFTNTIPAGFLNGTITGTPSAIDSGLVSNSGATAYIQVHEGALNIEAYGAVGNNSTDNSTFLQNAINAAAGVNGGAVFSPPGIYLTGPLTVPAGVVIKGVNGQGYKDLVATVANANTLSEWKLKTGSAGALLSPNDTSSTSTQVQMLDMAFNCNGVAQPAINMPDGSAGARFWLMDRIYAFNTTGANCIYIGQTNNAVTLRDSAVYNGTGGAAAGTNGVNWAGNDGTIDGTWIGFFGTYGLIAASGASDIDLKVRGGGIFGCAFAAVNTGGGLVLDNVSIDGNAYGIYATYGPVTVIGCRFVSNTSPNIFIALANVQVTTLGNRVAGTTAPYHVQTNGNACTINDFGTIIESGCTFGTGYTDFVTPAFPATGTPITNNGPGAVTAYITNGTGAITSLTVNSINTGLGIAISGSGQVRIPAGQSFACNYSSGTPTWVWVRG
jgi:hypothetical protein